MAEQIITLKNRFLKVSISSKGAELKSIEKNGKEKLWQGDPAYWAGQAPLMFPICGGLKEDKYILDGREYTLEKHGYARFCEFIVECAEKEKAVFLLCSDEESFKKFPFDYELRVIYTLDNSTLNVSYEVKNLSDRCMYFSIGAHEGYSCPEGIEEYSVLFEKEEDLESTVLNGNLLEHRTINLGKNTFELPLKYEYFAVDAQVFLNLKSKNVKLRNNETGDEVALSFFDHEYFLLWTKPGAKYICMEPWSGHQDFMDSNYDITEKPGIIKLQSNETCSKKHSMTF